jgi:hypothetical protein
MGCERYCLTCCYCFCCLCSSVKLAIASALLFRLLAGYNARDKPPPRGLFGAWNWRLLFFKCGFLEFLSWSGEEGYCLHVWMGGSMH